VLADIRDFFFRWQPLPLALFVVGWLWGGGWLLLRSLRKHQYPKRIKIGNTILVSFLAGMGGLVVMMSFFYLLNVIGNLLGSRKLVLAIGAVPALTAGGATAYLVIYAMLDLSLERALRIAIAPLFAILLFGAAIAAPTGIYSVKQRRVNFRKQLAVRTVATLATALRTYQTRLGRPAQELQALVEQNLIAADDLASPAAPHKQIGYFYRQTWLTSPDEPSRQIVLCDFRDNHGDGRNVVFANGEVIWYDEHEFRSLLEQDQNKEFADDLAAVEPD